ncbi:hypothetical protein [Campylobacter concisus]|uniref:hypothetical protein n=1 Tax=Campylobacter concisus TaxID=199 RepID=UPI00138AD593|nr:hypothetical protein [Campylobacter concisus]
MLEISLILFFKILSHLRSSDMPDYKINILKFFIYQIKHLHRFTLADQKPCSILNLSKFPLSNFINLSQAANFLFLVGLVLKRQKVSNYKNYRNFKIQALSELGSKGFGSIMKLSKHAPVAKERALMCY